MQLSSDHLLETLFTALFFSINSSLPSVCLPSAFFPFRAMPVRESVDSNDTQSVDSIDTQSGAGAGAAIGNQNTSGSEEVSSYSYKSHPLSLNPNTDHTPDNYEDPHLGFSPLLFRAMERHMHPDLLSQSQDTKVQYISNILNQYTPEVGPVRDLMNKQYRLNILSRYKPLHTELYTMNASEFFVPSFLKAVKDNTKESYRKIMAEPLSGVFVFDMFQKSFCQMLISEVENFERWACLTNYKIMRPNLMNKFGAVLDDFGLETMLNKLVEDFISPIAGVFFSEVGGTTLDSHHGYVVEYGIGRDYDLGYHVDSSEVTLNACLGKSFSGGELYFRGVRCNEHIDSRPKPEEILDYVHVPGRAVLHHGRHRHGAKATKSGSRINLLLWCRSSAFKEMQKHQKEFPDWCGKCLSKKKERQRQNHLKLKSMMRGDQINRETEA